MSERVTYFKGEESEDDEETGSVIDLAFSTLEVLKANLGDQSWRARLFPTPERRRLARAMSGLKKGNVGVTADIIEKIAEEECADIGRRNKATFLRTRVPYIMEGTIFQKKAHYFYWLSELLQTRLRCIRAGMGLATRREVAMVISHRNDEERHLGKARTDVFSYSEAELIKKLYGLRGELFSQGNNANHLS